MTNITIFNKKYDINLKELYLSDNELSTLPPAIGNLINLNELYL